MFGLGTARTPPESLVPVKVWDLPVRLFHWVLVVLFVFQLVTAKQMLDSKPRGARSLFP